MISANLLTDLQMFILKVPLLCELIKHKLTFMLIVGLLHHLMTFAERYNYFLKVRNENVLILSSGKQLALLI